MERVLVGDGESEGGEGEGGLVVGDGERQGMLCVMAVQVVRLLDVVWKSRES